MFYSFIALFSKYKNLWNFEARGKSRLKIAYMIFVILESHDFVCDFCVILVIFSDFSCDFSVLFQ